jgi:hypothetical protein
LSFVEEEVADGSHAIVALLLSLEVVSNVDVRVEICSGTIGWGRLPSCHPSPPRTTRRARSAARSRSRPRRRLWDIAAVLKEEGPRRGGGSVVPPTARKEAAAPGGRKHAPPGE